MEPDTVEMIALVGRATQRDPRAFQELFERYYARTCGYLVSRGVAYADADDIAADVFFKAWTALERYEQRGVPFGQWLFKIAERETVSFVRRNQRHQAASLEDKMIEPTIEVHSEPDETYAILDQLTPMQADVVRMRYYDDMTSAEIGEVMGINDGSVRALQFRGLAELRKRIA